MASRFSQGLKALGADEPRQRSAPVQKEHTPASRTSGGQQPAPQEHEQPRYMAPSRVGKKALTCYFDPAVRQQLAVLAAEEDRSQNDLIAEALNMLFERYRKSPIAKG